MDKLIALRDQALKVLETMRQALGVRWKRAPREADAAPAVGQHSARPRPFRFRRNARAGRGSHRGILRFTDGWPADGLQHHAAAELADDAARSAPR